MKMFFRSGVILRVTPRNLLKSPFFHVLVGSFLLAYCACVYTLIAQGWERETVYVDFKFVAKRKTWFLSRNAFNLVELASYGCKSRFYENWGVHYFLKKIACENK